MDRDILASLDTWKSSSHRKPLILNGARQVGKTWALREFGRTRYKNYAYFSLENIAPGIPSEYASFFEQTRDPHRIINNLALASGINITPDETLIIFDEVQDCPAAIGSLKYFQESAPSCHIACAGSLLGVHLSRTEGAFPVGKVEFLPVFPMTFSEYLRAVGANNLDAFIQQIDELSPLPDLFANQLTEHLQRYFSTGGMPEAVSRWNETGDMTEVDKVLSDLIDAYERDFAKHGGRGQFAKLSLIWNSLPAQLARENKKFLYGLVRKGARAREYEDAIEWLVSAGLINRITRCKAPGLPLAAYDDASSFKTYCLDVGVLRRLARLDATVFGTRDAMFREFKGAFAENYVIQALIPQLDTAPRYWTNDKPRYEVDSLIQIHNNVIPIEVKSGENITSARLRYYGKKYTEKTPLRIRISLRNLSYDGDVLNIPLYLAHRTVSFAETILGK